MVLVTRIGFCGLNAGIESDWTRCCVGNLRLVVEASGPGLVFLVISRPVVTEFGLLLFLFLFLIRIM